MTVTTELYQGDSSDVVSVGVFLNDAQVTGSDLDDYNGKFTVMKTLGGNVLIEKSMSVADDTFRSQITPAESAELDVGNYFGVIEITNDSLSFRKEHHIKISIRKQGFIDS